MSTDRSGGRVLPAFLAALAAALPSACGEPEAEARPDADPPEEVREVWAPGPPLARRPERAEASSRSAGAPPRGTSAGASGQELDLDRIGYDFGSPDAPVRVVEFSDFGCGFCRRFHMETYPTLHEEYVETGKVRWTYVPYILGIFGPNAVDAALAGECAGEQDRASFVAVRERLYANQAEWKGADDPGAHFRRYAREAGLDGGRFAACMEEMRRQERVVFASRLGRELGIRGTPTFFIPGHTVIPGALPVETFRIVLDQVLAEARSAQGGDGGK